MRILLVGEYSRLHNSLKEGLLKNGHEVTLISNGDWFKNYPSDISIKPTLTTTNPINYFRQIIFKFFKIDICKIEIGIKFYQKLPLLKNFDVVQLINEAPIQTFAFFERYLLQKLFHQNKNTFLLCCGVDYAVVNYLVKDIQKYSILTPYFNNVKAKKEYDYVFFYLSRRHKKTHQLVIRSIQGIIASDIDYVLAIKNNSLYKAFIPNAINTDKIAFIPNKITDIIILFLGINRANYFAKGISFFEDALKIIKIKYSNKVEIIIAENLQYNEYINQLKKAHIVLDQVYSYDQGYNALESMAMGKTVFTGAETEFLDYYNLTEDTVCINALPNVNYLINKLSYLIENPIKIEEIGISARKFIETHHQNINVAKEYEKVWNG